MFVDLNRPHRQIAPYQHKKPIKKKGE